MEPTSKSGSNILYKPESYQVDIISSQVKSTNLRNIEIIQNLLISVHDQLLALAGAEIEPVSELTGIILKVILK